MQKTYRIRQLNDELRTNFRGGKIAVTPGVLALGDISTILNQLRGFSAFDPRNDQERAFGAFNYAGRPEIDGDGPLLFFKIDYLDPSLTFASSDPASPDITFRLLTLMLSEEI